MPYTQTEGQKRWLRTHFAKEADMARCCDCPGCETCKGFVRNCKCDYDLSFLEERRNKK